MSIRITVKSEALVSRMTKSGKTMYTQTAYAHVVGQDGKPEDFPVKIALTIWSDKDGKPERPAYQPGDYTLSPQSFFVGEYARLEVAPRLVAIAATKA